MGVTGISLERKVGLGSTRGKESDRWYMDDFGVVYTKKYSPSFVSTTPRVCFLLVGGLAGGVTIPNGFE